MIEKGHFTWGDQDSEPVLKNLNLCIPRGSLVAIVGGVGSGKTSLLSALLGDMDKISGRVNIKGRTPRNKKYFNMNDSNYFLI